MNVNGFFAFQRHFGSRLKKDKFAMDAHFEKSAESFLFVLVIAPFVLANLVGKSREVYNLCDLESLCSSLRLLMRHDKYRRRSPGVRDLSFECYPYPCMKIVVN